MATNKKTKTFFKLGEGASTFHCPTTRLNINNQQVVPHEGPLSQTIKRAISNGHILEVDEDEYDAFKEDASDELESSKKSMPDFPKMAKADIIEWAKENIEFTDVDEEEKFFENLASTKKKTELISLVTKQYEEN